MIFEVMCELDNAVDIADFVDANLDFFTSEYGIEKAASHDTFSRILRIVDIKEFASCLGEFLKATFYEKYKEYGDKKILHIDGKAIKASTKNCNGQYTVYFMNSMYEGGTISLNSEKIEEKSNEIKAIPNFLDNFILNDCIVTIDTISCNTNIINMILVNGGSYLILVKENQKFLFNAIIDEFQNLIKTEKINDLDCSKTLNKNHGRIEESTAYLLTDTSFIVGNKNIKKEFYSMGSILVTD